MSSIRSPCVVFFYGACVTTASVCVVLELCQKGSLCDLMQSQKEQISWPRAIKLMSDMARCVHVLRA